MNDLPWRAELPPLSGVNDRRWKCGVRDWTAAGLAEDRGLSTDFLAPHRNLRMAGHIVVKSVL